MRLDSEGVWKGALAALFVIATAVTAACEPDAVATPSIVPDTTHSGGPNAEPGRPLGSLYLTLKAPLPDQPVLVGYIGPDGMAESSTDMVPDNHGLTVSRTFVAGAYGLRANAIACGRFEIELNRESDVDLTVSPTACALTIVQVHGAEVTHPDPADSTGTILGSGPARAQIRLVPLNVAEAPQEAESDESGAFSFDGLLPGRYRLIVAGKDESAREILVVAGEITAVSLRVATEPP